jgi:hypothetical protein
MALRGTKRAHSKNESLKLQSTDTSSSEDEPHHVPDGHDIVERVLAYDPHAREYLIRWHGFPSGKDNTWESAQGLVSAAAADSSAIERFRLRDMANVGWVFAGAADKRAFHRKHDLIDLGDLPLPVRDPNRNTQLHTLSQAQRKEYVQWLKTRIGQCEWVAGCTHRVSRVADASDGGWPVECFDFHHVRAATKAHTVSTMPVTIFPAESIWAEAAKCILLCRMHHAIIEHVSRGSEEGFSPECTAAAGGGGACEFQGHSLYGYVHPDAGRHAREEPWTTPALLARRGRPWLPQDVPPAREPKAKQRK